MLNQKEELQKICSSIERIQWSLEGLGAVCATSNAEAHFLSETLWVMNDCLANHVDKLNAVISGGAE